MKSQELATKLLGALKREAGLEKWMKDVHKEIAGLKQELFESMRKEGMDALTIEGIEFKPEVVQDFSLSDQFRGAQWDSVPDWFKWLRDIGEGDLIKVKESVHPGTRKRFLKEWIEEENPLPGFIKEVFFDNVKYNKSAVRRLAESEIADV